jgi:hypothetical protein
MVTISIFLLTGCNPFSNEAKKSKIDECVKAQWTKFNADKSLHEAERARLRALNALENKTNKSNQNAPPNNIDNTVEPGQHKNLRARSPLEREISRSNQSEITKLENAILEVKFRTECLNAAGIKY